MIGRYFGDGLLHISRGVEGSEARNVEVNSSNILKQLNLHLKLSWRAQNFPRLLLPPELSPRWPALPHAPTSLSLLGVSCWSSLTGMKKIALNFFSLHSTASTYALKLNEIKFLRLDLKQVRNLIQNLRSKFVVLAGIQKILI